MRSLRPPARSWSGRLGRMGRSRAIGNKMREDARACVRARTAPFE